MAGLQVGKVIGYHSLYLLRYRRLWLPSDFDFPTSRHRSRLNDVSLLYQMYLMPDHIAGPIFQIGPSALGGGGQVYGGVVVSTGLYAHSSTRLSFELNLSFERVSTAAIFDHASAIQAIFGHDATWGREVSCGFNWILGGHGDD